MKKIKYIAILVILISLSSCGIFKKDCHCPHFSKAVVWYKGCQYAFLNLEKNENLIRGVKKLILIWI